MKLISLFILLLSMNSFGQTRVLQKPDKLILIWNSVSKNLDDHIYCSWIQGKSKDQLIIDRCVLSNTKNNLGKDILPNKKPKGTLEMLINYFTGNKAVDGELTVIRKADVIVDTSKCEVLMEGQIIGEYYGSSDCREKYESTFLSKGIKITNAYVEIDLIDMKLTIE